MHGAPSYSAKTREVYADYGSSDWLSASYAGREPHTHAGIRRVSRSSGRRDREGMSLGTETRLPAHRYGGVLQVSQPAVVL